MPYAHGAKPAVSTCSPSPSSAGALLLPARWTPPPAIHTELQQRLAQRDTLVDLRLQVRNQLHALIQQLVVISRVRTRMETLIRELTDQIGEV
jgi:hypothetical protein